MPTDRSNGRDYAAVRLALPLVLLLIAPIGAQESAPSPGDEAVRAAAAWREGRGAPSDIERFADQLIAADAAMAADWWVAHVEAALAKRIIAGTAKDAVVAARRKLRNAMSPSREARAIYEEARRLAREMIEKKAPGAAMRALDAMRMSSIAHADDDWTAETRELEKRAEKLPKTAVEAKVTDIDRTAIEDVTARARADIEAASTRAVATFDRFGGAPGFVPVDALLRSRAPSAAAGADNISFHKAARRFGLGKRMIVRAVSTTKLRLRQDGEPVILPGASADGFTDATKGAIWELVVCLGETVAIETASGPVTSRSIGSGVISSSAEVFAVAAIDGAPLSPSAWQAATLDQIDQPRPTTGGLLMATPAESKTVRDQRSRKMWVMNYQEPGRKPKDPDGEARSIDDMTAKMLGDSSAARPYTDEHRAMEKSLGGDAPLF